MQINGYGNVLNSYNLGAQNSEESNGTMIDIQIAKNIAAGRTAAIQKLDEDELKSYKNPITDKKTEGDLSQSICIEGDFIQSEADFEKSWLQNKEEREMIQKTQQERISFERSQVRKALLSLDKRL